MYEQQKDREVAPEASELDVDEQLERYFLGLTAVMDELRTRSFASLEEATTAEAMISQKTQELLEIEGYEGVLLTISGPGVSQPPVTMQPVGSENGDTGVSISLESHEFEPFDILTSRQVRLYSVITSIDTNHESTDDVRYSVSAKYIMQDVYPTVAALSVDGFPLPAVTVAMLRSYSVDCSSDSIIEFPELQERRHQAELADKLATTGLINSLLHKKLDKLRVALEDERDDVFVEVPSIKMVRDIGRLAGEHSRRGPDYSELVRRALLNVFDEGRMIEVSGVPYGFDNDAEFTVDVHGAVVGILLPETRDDDVMPSLAIEVSFDGENTTIVQFPFESISSLGF